MPGSAAIAMTVAVGAVGLVAGKIKVEVKVAQVEVEVWALRGVGVVPAGEDQIVLAVFVRGVRFENLFEQCFVLVLGRWCLLGPECAHVNVG